MRRQPSNWRAVFVVVLGALAWSGSLISARRDAGLASMPPQAGDVMPALVDRYCASCHNGQMRSASGVLLDRFDAAHISERPEAWSRAYRQLQAGTMPPVGVRRPDRATVDAALISIEQALTARTESRAVASSQEIAERLAALVWNSAPDAALLQEAQRDGFSEPGALERHVRRMLADDRGRAFVSRFFFPWLELDALADADPDRRYFPEYDISLRHSLAKETELFVLSQLREDRDPVDLWSASYTFLNGQLAKHYGVPGVTGPEFRRVAWSTPERTGLLGHGSIHMVTSRHQHGVGAAYTSPAKRSTWVRLRFLGAALPNGFPGAQPVKPELPIAPQTRALPAQPCENCHRNFFPLGYALENFDPLGRWRTHDQAGPVDTSGAFVDGTPTNGVVQLRQALLQYADAFRTTVVEQLLIYATTGAPAASGTPETLIGARRVLRSTSDPRWSAIIAAVVRATAAAGGQADTP